MLRSVLDVLLPMRCAGCSVGAWPFCEGCRSALVPLAPPWCARCGRPWESQTARCRSCPPSPVTTARAAFLYEGPARTAVHRLKFAGWRPVAEALGGAMAEVVEGEADVVSWVPLSRRRRAERGFDQARALARVVAGRLGLPLAGLLMRGGETAPQARRGRSDRRAAVRGAFRATQRAAGGVLLVDDVLTTGATASECARALVDAGAVQVHLLAAARAIPEVLPARLYSGGFPPGSVVARGGGSPVVDASRRRNDPRKATVGR